MAHAGPAEAHTAAYPRPPLQNIINHRKLVATIFPRSADDAMADAAAAAAAIDNKGIYHCAASQGALSSVLALLADGTSSCDLPDRFGRTPLHWAAEQGHPDVARALLNAGACVDPLSQRKATPILLAASRGHLEAVRVLLHYRAGESDCWPLIRHSRGIGDWRSTALHCAAAGGHGRVVEALLDAGFDRGQHDGAGLTPAEVSARQSHYTSPAITHLLLPSDMGGKLVHDYVNMMMQDVAMISGLAKGGAFLDWQDGAGDAPLHRAVQFHHVAISRVLLRAGADANIRDHEGSSPLHMAACAGLGEIVADLLEAGADLEPLAVGGDCPLHRAVVQNRANVVIFLLSAGASTEHRDAIYGQTPLPWACQGCLAPMVRVLVEAGADTDSKSSAGLTPLHWACRFIDAESVEVLLNAGADPSAVDLAAADDALAVSPYRSGRSVSRPVAVDVIGLGFPLDRMENPRSPFSRRLTARRLDAASVQRIELALHAAQREHFWRRRGWLVILANRHVATGVPGVRGERAAFRHVDCSPSHPPLTQLQHGDTGVEQPPGAHQTGAAGYRVDPNSNGDSSDSEYPQTSFCPRQDNVWKRLRNVDSVSMTARGTFFQKNKTRGDIGGHENVAVRLPELVAALLRLAAVEVGVFRRVVMFI